MARLDMLGQERGLKQGKDLCSRLSGKLSSLSSRLRCGSSIGR